MNKLFKILFIIFLFSFFNFSFTSAYDNKTTHQALTDEIVDFYNLYYGNKSEEEFKQELVRGSDVEDTPPRWINHFYDPIYNKAWSGSWTHLGELTAVTS